MNKNGNPLLSLEQIRALVSIEIKLPTQAVIDEDEYRIGQLFLNENNDNLG